MLGMRLSPPSWRKSREAPIGLSRLKVQTSNSQRLCWIGMRICRSGSLTPRLLSWPNGIRLPKYLHWMNGISALFATRSESASNFCRLNDRDVDATSRAHRIRGKRIAPADSGEEHRTRLEELGNRVVRLLFYDDTKEAAFPDLEGVFSGC